MRYFYKTPNYIEYANYIKDENLRDKIEENEKKLLEEMPDKIKESYNIFMQEIRKYVDLPHPGEWLNDIEYNNGIISAYDFIKVIKNEFFGVYNDINDLMNYIKKSNSNSIFLGINKLKKCIENIEVVTNNNYIEIRFYFYLNSIIENKYTTFNIKKHIYTQQIYYEYNENNFTKKELKYLKNELKKYTDKIFSKETSLIECYDNRYKESREEILKKLLTFIKIKDNTILVDLDFNNDKILSEIKLNIDNNHSIDLSTVEKYFKINNIILYSHVCSHFKNKILKKIPINLNDILEKNNIFYFSARPGYKISIFDIYMDIINSNIELNNTSQKIKKKTK